MNINKKNILIFVAIITATISISFFLQDRYKKNSRPINVMIIVIDALRFDHLSCYGYKRDTSPNIDRFAKEGVKFTQAIAPGGWTVESVPSILTGAYSFTHQIYYWNSLRNPNTKSLAEELARKGYQNVFWGNHGGLNKLDIQDGFCRIYASGLYDKSEKSALSDYEFTSQIINRLRASYKNRPFFFYIHYEGVHAPYRPPAPYKYIYLHDKYEKAPKFVPISNINDGDLKYFGEKCIPFMTAENNITNPDYYISQYDGAISYSDAQIGRLLDSLRTLGLNENTLVILTSDHGEMLGEHDLYFTHNSSFEENIRVPLIIKLPRLFPEGEVISKQVSLVDIAPTVLEVIGLKKPNYMQGESLLNFFKPHKAYRMQYVFSSCKQWCTFRAENWKIIFQGSNNLGALYDLKNDPQEQHDLALKIPDKFKQLKQEFDNFKKCFASAKLPKVGPPLSEEEKARLRSLGYNQ